MSQPTNYSNPYADLLAFLNRLVRTDTVGASLNPNLISNLKRLTYPDGSSVTGGLDVRYPGCTATYSPPMTKVVDLGQCRLMWKVDALFSWSFPRFNYGQLPVGIAANLASKVASLLPKSYRLTSARVGAEQVDGSDVWMVLLKLELEYPQAISPDFTVGALQPEDFGSRPAVEISQIDLGIWRSPSPLDKSTAVLDTQISIEPN